MMRTKLQFCCSWLSPNRYRYFTEALESVLGQSYENLNIILLQDSWWRTSGRPKRVGVPKFCRDIINHHWEVTHKEPTARVYFYSCNSRGAAHALYNIREVLFKHSINDEDIVILLDDDDLLAYSGAVKDIVARMDDGNAKVCVTQFKTIGQVETSIVNRGGGRHNELVKQGALKADMETPFGPGSLCFADSLGWTKSYRVGLLKEYHNDLLNHFGSKRNLVKFLCKNDAFEDFPEIINLCRKDCDAVGLDKKTHAYRKLRGSITNSPHRRDFVHKRPNYLALLMGLYKELKSGGKLFDEGDTKAADTKAADATAADMVIARYFAVKILTVENVLAKYRSDEKTHWDVVKLEKGDFLRRLLVVLRKNQLLNDFTELLKRAEYLEFKEDKERKAMENEQYNEDKPDSPFMLLSEACENEAFHGKVDINNVLCDAQMRRRVKKLTSSYLKYVALVLSAVAVVIIAFQLAGDDSQMWRVVIAALVPFVTWLYTLYKKDKEKRELRKKHTDIFSESVNELRRHVMAGLRILLQVKKEMYNHPDCRPAKIHFTNLKVLSQLMSNKWDEYIVWDKFGHLPNLRVNVRNINNSAVYMEEYVVSSGYTPEKMEEIIDWEIVRYLSYITRFWFFVENKSFVLPNNNQLDIFVKSNDVLEKMAKEMLPDGETKEMLPDGVTKKKRDDLKKEIKEELDVHYNRYLNDRRKKREVLFV